MADTETLKQILAELKKINTELQNIKASVDDNAELLMGKLGTLESISDKSRTILKDIESNTTP